jgi:hypothetical protein
MKHAGVMRWASMLLIQSMLAGCHGSACTNTVTSGTPSPDGIYIAFIFNRSCAGEPAGTDVSVVRFSAALHDEPGNVLKANGLQPVRLFWLGPTQLVVTHAVEAPFRQTRPLESITVEFRP